MATLNHIGVAVADLAGMKKLFSLLGLEVTEVEKVVEQGVVTHFLPVSAQESHIELLDPIDANGPVAQFMKKKGPGIHHLSFEVQRGELDALCGRLRAEGYRLIYDQPKQGARGMRVNFLHPSSCGGILIEVMEPH